MRELNRWKLTLRRPRGQNPLARYQMMRERWTWAGLCRCQRGTSPRRTYQTASLRGCKRARKVPVVAVLDWKAAARPILRAALTVETKHVTQLHCACLVTLASCEPLPVPAAKSANTNTRSGHETAAELAGRWKDRLETEADSPVLGCDQKELVPGTITKDHQGHSSPAPFARWSVCLSSKRWPKHTGHPGSDLSFLLLPNGIKIPLFPVPTAIAGCLGGGGRLVSSCRSGPRVVASCQWGRCMETVLTFNAQPSAVDKSG